MAAGGTAAGDGSANPGRMGSLGPFYRPKPIADFTQKLEEICHGRIRKRKLSFILDNDKMDTVWRILASRACVHQNAEVLDYESFKRVGAEVPEEYQRFFSGKNFIRFPTNENGHVNILHVFNVLLRMGKMLHSRYTMSLFDTTNSGFLYEADLEEWFAEVVKTLPGLSSMDKGFEDLYCVVAVRKLAFFVEQRGRIPIKDLLMSSSLRDFYKIGDAVVPVGLRAKNWFSVEQVQEIFESFVKLDKDEDGMLSPEELMRYGNGKRALTEAFVTRLCQEVSTNEGKLDFRNYMNFVLAIENMRHPRSQKYLFRVLDLNHTGRVDAFAINFFYRDIVTGVEELDRDGTEEGPVFNDFIAEIFDLVKPQSSFESFSLKDLVRSKSGHIVIGILIDVTAFFNHDCGNDASAGEENESADF